MLPGYTHDFLTVAEQHVAAAQAKGVDGEVDAMIAIIALQNAVVGATKILGRGHPAVKACLSELPDLKDVRDMLTHFDEYVVGGGRLQAPSPVVTAPLVGCRCGTLPAPCSSSTAGGAMSCRRSTASPSRTRWEPDPVSRTVRVG